MLGLNSSSNTEQRVLSFNVNNQNFTVLPISLKQVRRGHQCAFIPKTRNVIVTGGYSNDHFDSTEIINVKTLNVTDGPPMNAKRAYHGIGVLNTDGQDRVVVFGGRDHWASYLQSVEIYTAQTQKWDLTNIELSEARAEFGFMTIKSQP